MDLLKVEVGGVLGQRRRRDGGRNVVNELRWHVNDEAVRCILVAMPRRRRGIALRFREAQSWSF